MNSFIALMTKVCALQNDSIYCIYVCARGWWKKVASTSAGMWFVSAELYLVLNEVNQAEACVAETSAMFPLSHQVYYMVCLFIIQLGHLAVEN